MVEATILANVNCYGIIVRKGSGMLQGLQIADVKQFPEASALFRQNSSFRGKRKAPAMVAEAEL
jgi:hypothetical protein